jgi:hypothetical protein
MFPPVALPSVVLLTLLRILHLKTWDNIHASSFFKFLDEPARCPQMEKEGRLFDPKRKSPPAEVEYCTQIS